MTLQKQKPMRSRKLLDAAKGQPCVICGDDRTTVAAHYSGLYADRLGKGVGQKSGDIFAAHLCALHHAELDQYINGNTDARALRFFLAVFETQKRLFEQGVLRVA